MVVGDGFFGGVFSVNFDYFVVFVGVEFVDGGIVDFGKDDFIF